MPRKIRVLVGKPGLDGHDRGAKVVAAALRDAGMEVIYTGLHQSAEQIVEAALQEDVDVVALSILSGAHMTLFPEVLELMRQKGIGDKLLSGGGIIPAEDMETLSGMGVGKLFGPGASTQEIAEYIRGWFVARHGAGTLAPGASPVARTKQTPVPRASRAPRPAAGTPTRPASRSRSAGPAPRAARAGQPARSVTTAKRPANGRASAGRRKPQPPARKRSAARKRAGAGRRS
jgi:methylmalonyl-CoA mutase C-terminal domain/subunit